MELYLNVELGRYGLTSFEVYRDMRKDWPSCDSVFIVKNYPYTPWPRKGGNLLW